MFSWFDASEAIATGISMAERIIKTLPPAALAGNAKAGQKHQQALENLYQQIERENIKRKYNAYKKARLASAFQDTLFEAGYDQTFVMAATKRLVMKAAYGKERF
ncbi:hypothetical protein [Massilia sp. TS11]|uniref:hypothetical protein n=1 Tax=Massilia sp. TS11 TaxID=2908003 RepID=UPI001EDA2C06|nr:hypothetical protein [Massilia sp. TS11]MCG2584586.1 hypothetical protein [Massilia sp. TS11]